MKPPLWKQRIFFSEARFHFLYYVLTGDYLMIDNIFASVDFDRQMDIILVFYTNPF